ncbi:MAG: hypothetical protein IE933_03050 [Sphingomonadales bacterium]|nr:hypothetical protein [Sphingomonadales bacterium]MBD3774278.1 hypothetical protein [Paracoccaceae bacterium]
MFTSTSKDKFSLAILGACLLCAPLAAQAQGIVRAEPTYADLADLADGAKVVLQAEIRKQVVVEPARAPGLKPGFARLYIEARTLSLLSGKEPVGESLRYLVDVPLDAKGKVPKLKKQQVLLFARTVPGRPGELQLQGPDAQQPWSEELATRLRPILAAMADPSAPAAVTGVRDAISVEGNLAGESESQIFLSTREGEPVTISVIRRPGQPPVWGVSWTDIVDQAAAPPSPGTLAWYRLACFLPGTIPASANLSRDGASRSRAAADYRYVVEQLGQCPRNLHGLSQ